MSLLPSSYDSSAEDDGEPRVVDVESEEADEVFDALSSATARKLLTQLHESPAPPAELADRVDTSVQNVQYHLGKLEDAGAIEVVDTAYSEKGREMDVYAPADQALVIFAGDDEESSTLRTALSRLLGSLGIVALASLLVQALASQQLFPFDSGGSPDSSPPGDEGSAGAGGDDSGGADDASGDAGNGYDTEATRSVGDSGTTDGGDTGTTDSGDAPEQEVNIEASNETEVQDVSENLTEANVSENLTDAADAVDQTAATDPQTTVDTVASLPPGVLFFLGGAFALCLVFGVLYYRERG